MMQEITASNQIELFKKACEQDAPLETIKKIIEFDVRAIKRHRKTCQYLTTNNVDLVLSYGVNPNRSINPRIFKAIEKRGYVFARLIEKGLKLGHRYLDVREDYSTFLDLNLLLALYKRGFDISKIFIGIFSSQREMNKAVLNIIDIANLFIDLDVDIDKYNDSYRSPLLMSIGRIVTDKYKCIELIDLYTTRLHLDINYKNRHGESLLNECITRKDEEFTRKILSLGATAKDLKADFACESLDTLKYMMKHGLDINDESFYSSQIIDDKTPLEFIEFVLDNVREDIIPRVCEWFIKKIMVHYKDVYLNEAINLIKFLVKRCGNKKLDVFSICKPNDIFYANPKILEYICKNFDIDVNCVIDTDKMNISMICKDLDVLKFLIDSGIDLYYKDSYGKTSFDYILERDDHVILEYIIKKGFTVNRESVFKYAKENCLAVLKESGFDFGFINDNGENLLFYKRLSDINFSLFRDLGVDINKINNDGKNILSNTLLEILRPFDMKDHVCQSNHMWHIRDIGHIVSQGIDVNHITKHVLKDGKEIETSILFCAIKDVNTQLFNYLLSSPGFDPNIKDSKGRNVLHYIDETTSYFAVETLIKAGLDVDINDKYNCIKRALFLKNISLAFEILRRNTDIIPDDCIMNFLGQDIKYEKYSIDYESDIIEMLHERDVNINYKDSNGDTALIRASRNGNYNLMESLVNNNADVNIRNNDNKNALYYASTNIEILLSKNIEVSDDNIDNLAKYATKNIIRYVPKTKPFIEALIKHNKIEVLKCYKPYIDVPADFFMLDDIDYIKAVLDTGDTNIFFYLDEKQFPFALKYYIESDLYKGNARYYNFFNKDRKCISDIPNKIALEIFKTQEQRRKFLMKKHTKIDIKRIEYYRRVYRDNTNMVIYIYKKAKEKVLKQFDIERKDVNCIACDKHLDTLYTERKCYCTDKKDMFIHAKCIDKFRRSTSDICATCRRNIWYE